MIICEGCNKAVKALSVTLELEASPYIWHLPGLIKQSKSQGCFEFHPGCAKKALESSASKKKVSGKIHIVFELGEDFSCLIEAFSKKTDANRHVRDLKKKDEKNSRYSIITRDIL